MPSKRYWRDAYHAQRDNVDYWHDLWARDYQKLNEERKALSADLAESERIVKGLDYVCDLYEAAGEELITENEDLRERLGESEHALYSAEQEVKELRKHIADLEAEIDARERFDALHSAGDIPAHPVYYINDVRVTPDGGYEYVDAELIEDDEDETDFKTTVLDAILAMQNTIDGLGEEVERLWFHMDELLADDDEND